MLEIKNIVKTYNSNPCPTLNNINLKVSKGEFCVILGSNGSGKSTLMKLISGHEKPDSGQILLDNKNITKNKSQHIAYVTQNVEEGTIAEMTLLENMILNGLVKRKLPLFFYSKHQDHMTDLLDKIDSSLSSYINTPLKNLSGGQRQRIVTLMAIMSSPSLLLLDEHTSSLDPANQKALMRFTSQAAKNRGITTIMITHDLEDAHKYADRILIMKEGMLYAEISRKQLNQITIQKLSSYFNNAKYARY